MKHPICVSHIVAVLSSDAVTINLLLEEKLIV
jgi:hypothetical protein